MQQIQMKSNCKLCENFSMWTLNHWLMNFSHQSLVRLPNIEQLPKLNRSIRENYYCIWNFYLLYESMMIAFLQRNNKLYQNLIRILLKSYDTKNAEYFTHWPWCKRMKSRIWRKKFKKNSKLTNESQNNLK